MSATVVARGLGAAYADRSLFTGLDLVVAPAEVVGLVGPNGAGKSTLLNMLAGRIPPGLTREGSVSLNPAAASIGFLPQEHQPHVGESVHAYLARRTTVGAAQTQPPLERRGVPLTRPRL